MKKLFQSKQAKHEADVARSLAMLKIAPGSPQDVTKFIFGQKIKG